MREAEGSRPKRRRPAKRVAAFEIKVEEIDFSFTRWADEIQPVIVGAKDFPFVSAETDYQQEPKAFSLERAFLPTKTELRRLLAVSEVVPGPLNVWAVDVPLLAS
ncbi:MAG: hypothetical protein JKY65_11465 [Planctomycetes bacterium]|nr:hypothetical protein [Planctomycetota bacterium]